MQYFISIQSTPYNGTVTGHVSIAETFIHIYVFKRSVYLANNNGPFKFYRGKIQMLVVTLLFKCCYLTSRRCQWQF